MTIVADDNVVQFSLKQAAKQAANAMDEYAAGLADVTHGRQKAIMAVVAYGEALLQGRGQYKSNRVFAQWVSDNRFDVGKPWDNREERTAAMNIAEIVRGNTPPDAFHACPFTRPTDIMKWYRKQHRPPQPSRAEATKKALEAIETMVALGEAITEDRITERAGVAAGTANKAFTLYRAKKEAAAKASAETAAKLNEDQQIITADFSPKSRITIDKAIAIHKKRLDNAFEAVVNAEVRRRIDAADSETRKQLAKLHQENLWYQANLRQGALFTQADFKMLLMCLHPDNSASPEIRARIFDLVKQKERRLVGQ